MAKKKVCKNCKFVFESDGECPNCRSNVIANSSQGRIFIKDPNKSEIAKKIDAKMKGEYAMKVR